MGIPGAGKSTVLSTALKSAPEWRVINWGDRMLELAKAQGTASHRDDIRKLSPEKQAALQDAVAESLARERGKFVLDTHCSVKTPKGYLPGLPFRLLGKLAVERLVLIEAPSSSILSRRQQDASRARDSQLASEIEEQLFVNKSLVCAYSAFTGAAVSFIENRDGEVAAAAQMLAALMG
jgi:adenylate kinase